MAEDDPDLYDRIGGIEIVPDEGIIGGMVITGGIMGAMYLGIPIADGRGIPGTIGGLPGYDMTKPPGACQTFTQPKLCLLISSRINSRIWKYY